MRVTLVRHARSAADPATPAHTWDLTPEGRLQAQRLRLDGVSRLLAGPEPKLASTLAHLGPVEIDERFAESGQTEGWLGADDFLAAVRSYHAGAPRPGWEPAAEVVDRFTSGFADGVAICSGGRAISAVVAHLTGVDGFAFWQTLDMPAVVVLDRDDRGTWVASPPRE